MGAQPVVIPLQDSNGNPVADAIVTFKKMDTATDQAAFSDKGLATPLANPYTLNDSAGYFLAYLDNSKDYDITVKSNDQATTYAQWSQPSVFSEDDEDSAYLTPLDYGAVGDGVTDDTAAVQAFLQACYDTSTIGSIPGGYTFLVTNATVTGDNETSYPSTKRLHIVGNGGAIAASGAGNTIYVNGVYRPIFEGIHWIGTADADSGVYNSGSPQVLCRFNQCSMPIFRSNTTRRVSGFGVWVERCQPATRHLGALITGNLFNDHPYDSGSDLQAAIFLQDNGEYNIITENRWENCPAFIRAVGGANTLIYGNILMGCNRTGGLSGNHGIIFFEPGASNDGKINIIANKINHNEDGMWAINIVGGGASTKNANRIIGNEFLVHGDAAQGEIVRIRGYYGNVISENKFRTTNTSPTGHAIWLDNATAIAGLNEFEQVGDSCWRLFNSTSSATVSAASGGTVLTVVTEYFPWDRVTAGQTLTISGGTSIDGAYTVASADEGAGTITISAGTWPATVASVSATLALSGSGSELYDEGNIYADGVTKYSLQTANDTVIIDGLTIGTFTPTADFSTTGDFSPTYNTQSGWYSKDRNGIVEFNLLIDFDTNAYTTASGNLEIGGLPDSAAADQDQWVVTVGELRQLTVSSSVINIAGRIDDGTNYVIFRLCSSAANGSSLGTAHASASTSGIKINLSGRYKAAA